MMIEEAIEIVKEEAAFCRHLAKKDGENVGGDFAVFSIRKAEAQETVVADIERLRQQLLEAKAIVALRDHQQNCHWYEVGGCRCDECDRLTEAAEAARSNP